MILSTFSPGHRWSYGLLFGTGSTGSVCHRRLREVWGYEGSGVVQGTPLAYTKGTERPGFLWLIGIQFSFCKLCHFQHVLVLFSKLGYRMKASTTTSSSSSSSPHGPPVPCPFPYFSLAFPPTRAPFHFYCPWFVVINLPPILRSQLSNISPTITIHHIS